MYDRIPSSICTVSNCGLFIPDLRKKHTCPLLILLIGITKPNHEILLLQKAPKNPYRYIEAGNKGKQGRIKEKSYREPGCKLPYRLRMPDLLIYSPINHMIIIWAVCFLTSILQCFFAQQGCRYSNAKSDSYPHHQRPLIP